MSVMRACHVRLGHTQTNKGPAYVVHALMEKQLKEKDHPHRICVMVSYIVMYSSTVIF